MNWVYFTNPQINHPYYNNNFYFRKKMGIKEKNPGFSSNESGSTFRKRLSTTYSISNFPPHILLWFL